MNETSPPGLLIVCAAALVDGDGRVLVQQVRGGANDGLWEFPGGKVEPGETPAACLIRELDEELGIDVEAACLAPAVFSTAPLGDRHLLLLLHVCRKWRGQPRPVVAQALRWLRPVELHALPMPVPDRPLIGLIEALV